MYVTSRASKKERKTRTYNLFTLDVTRQLTPGIRNLKTIFVYITQQNIHCEDVINKLKYFNIIITVSLGSVRHFYCIRIDELNYSKKNHKSPFRKLSHMLFQFACELFQFFIVCAYSKFINHDIGKFTSCSFCFFFCFFDDHDDIRI